MSTEHPTINVDRLIYRSGDITWIEWFSLFTLCLAPLIAHVVAGIPQPSVLSTKPPPWHEHLCHYNPTSILWRYYAITNRRLRAGSWEPLDMAAANALFWTGNAWDGSSAMAITSRPYILVTPDRPHTEIFSATTIKSIIVLLQGIGAVYAMLQGLDDDGLFASLLSVGTIFQPLAVFGLLRVFAAFWLTENCIYGLSPSDPQRPAQVVEDDADEDEFDLGMGSATARERVPLTALPSMTATGTTLPSSPPPGSSSKYVAAAIAAKTANRDDKRNRWLSWAFRIVYVTPLILLCVLCGLYSVTMDPEVSFSVTTFLVILFYVLFLTITIVIYVVLFIRGADTVTVIPCISTWWYKTYTGILIAMMLVLASIAAVETYKLPCGEYTTFPKENAWLLCPCFKLDLSETFQEYDWFYQC